MWELDRCSVTPHVLAYVVGDLFQLFLAVTVQEACQVRSGSVLYWLPDPLCCAIPVRHGITRLFI